MTTPNVIRNTLGTGLVGAMFFFTIPAYAGKLATPMLPGTFSPHVDWGYTAVVTNLGRHTETFVLSCFTSDRPAIDRPSSHTLDSGASVMVFVDAPQGWNPVRCEIEFQGSANSWRFLLCNYDEKYVSGGYANQCIEGR